MTKETNAPVQVEVAMGAMSEPLAEQLQSFGLPDKQTNQLQKIADIDNSPALTGLYLTITSRALSEKII